MIGALYTNVNAHLGVAGTRFAFDTAISMKFFFFEGGGKGAEEL